MISSFHRVNSYRPGTSFRVPPSGHWRSWRCNGKTRACKVNFGCSQNSNVIASVPSPGPRWRGRWCRVNSRSFTWKLKLDASRSGFSFASVRYRAILDSVPDEEDAADSSSLAFKMCRKSLAALALTLGIVSVTQPEPAYAMFGSSLRSGVHQIASRSSSSSETSVETILAKQLARRFREMSDEELIETLQQLLKASRSSPSPRTAVDEGTVPEDLTATPKDNWKLDAKNAEKVGAEVRGPEKQETNAGSDKVKEGNQTYEKTKAKLPGNDKISNEELTTPGPVLDADNQARKGTGEKMGKVTEPQGQLISKERPDAEQTSGDARPSDAQSSTGNENATSTISPKVEANRKAGDSSSGESLSNVPDTSDAAASSSGALRVRPSDGAGGAVGQPENATELLWGEWSRRTAGRTAEQSASSSSASSATEIWQNVQANGVLIGTELVVLTTSLFNSYKEVVGIVLICSLSLVAVFYLGRSHAASTRNASSGEQASIREQQVNKSSRVRSKDGLRGEGLEPWFPTLSETAPERSRRSTIADDGSTGSTAEWGRPSEATREPANRSSRSFIRPELTTSTQRGSGLDGVSSGEEDELLAESQGGIVDSFIRSNASSPYPRMISMKGKEKPDRISDSAARQTQSRWWQDDSVDATILGNEGQVYSKREEWNGREPRAQDQANQEATTSDNAVLGTRDGANYDKDYRTSARLRSKPNQGLGECGQDNEGRTPGRVKEMQDSFVHDSVLWVRDMDGVFVPESDTQGLAATAAKVSNTPPPQEAVEPMSSSVNDNLQRRFPKRSRKGSEIGYDYRQLVIDRNTQPVEDEQQEPINGFTRQKEPVPPGEQMWPLRYGHTGRQPMYN